MPPQVHTIGSDAADDWRLDDIRDLNHPRFRPDRIPRLDPRGHGEHREPLVVAEGELPVARVLGADSRVVPKAIFGRRDRLEQFAEKYPQLWDSLEAREVTVYELMRETLAEVVGFDLHRGLVAVAHRPEELSVEQVLDSVPTARTVAVLEGVGDPENIGTIFRNAASLGVGAVLFGAGCSDPFDRRVLRVSMGHAVRVPSAHFSGKATNWQHGLDTLRERGYRIVAMTPDPQALTLAEACMSAGQPVDKLAVMVGAEGPGLTVHARKAADCQARIPMAVGADSLNVATAAACAFYERQRSAG